MRRSFYHWISRNKVSRDAVSNLGQIVHRMRLHTTGKMQHKAKLNKVKMCLIVREVSIFVMKQEKNCIPVLQVSSSAPTELQEVSIK